MTYPPKAAAMRPWRVTFLEQWNGDPATGEDMSKKIDMDGLEWKHDMAILDGVQLVEEKIVLGPFPVTFGIMGESGFVIRVVERGGLHFVQLGRRAGEALWPDVFEVTRNVDSERLQGAFEAASEAFNAELMRSFIGIVEEN